MLELNPINDNFEVILPEGLFLDDLLTKFNKVLEGRYLIHNDFLDFINESLQSVSIPDIISEPNVITSKSSQMHKKPAFNQLFRIQDNAITLRFRMLDSKINYWLFRLNYIEYIRREEIIDNVGNLSIKFFDNSGTFSYTVTFIKCVLGGVEGQEFNYADENQEAEYFSIGLFYDDININVDIPSFNNDSSSNDISIDSTDDDLEIFSEDSEDDITTHTTEIN